MNRKTTVIFDLDGTLLDTLDDLTGSVNHALKEMGFPPRSREEIRSFVGNGMTVLIRKSLPAGISDVIVEETLGLFKKHYGIHCNDLTRPYEGIDDLINLLQDNKIKMAIVSNKPDFAVKDLTEIYFKGKIRIAIGEKESEGIRRKPSPDTVFKAMKDLDSKPEDSVYIGDSEVDIKTAQNAGIDLVLCAWGFRDEEFLRQEGGQAIIHHPLELLNMIE